VIVNINLSSQADFGMPISWSHAVSAAAVRTFPTTGEVSAFAAAGTKRRAAGVAEVCAYTRTADVAVLDGTFPGTSAWSPPI